MGTVVAKGCITIINVNDGGQGTGVSRTERQYYLSTSATSMTGGSWGTSVPTPATKTSSIWQRDATEYTDGRVDYTAAICISQMVSSYSQQIVDDELTSISQRQGKGTMNDLIDDMESRISQNANGITASVTQINGMAENGRNWLRQSDLTQNRMAYDSMTHTLKGTIASSGDKYWRWDLNALNDEKYKGKLTISFYAKSSVAGTVNIMATWANSEEVQTGTEYAYYHKTFDVDFTGDYKWGGFDFPDTLRGADVYVKDLMIAKGGTAMSYVPAIEDTIDIGAAARNWLRWDDMKNFIYGNKSYDHASHILSGTIDGNQWLWSLQRLYEEKYKGKLTMSMWIKSSICGIAKIFPKWNVEWHGFAVSADYTYIEHTFDVDYTNDANNGGLQFDESMYGGSFEIKELMMNKGSCAASYLPAQEDMADSNQMTSELKILSDRISTNVTDISSIGGRVTTAESKITQMSDEISLKVSATDYNGEKIASLINQSASTVVISAEHINLAGYLTIAAYNTLEIGGRNLIAGTSMQERTVTYPTTSGWRDIAYQSASVLTGTRFVMSFWAKASVNGSRIRCFFYSPDTTISFVNSQGLSGHGSDGYNYFELTTEWRRYWIAYVTDGTDSSVKNCIFARLTNGWGTGSVTVKGCKLEIGTKATDWTPAPEDLATSVSASQADIARMLGYGSYEDMCSQASQSKTIINGGFIRTSLIDAQAIVTQALVTEALSAGDATIRNLTVTSATIATCTIVGCTVSGTLDCNNATFDSGNFVNMTASSGTIGGWTIQSNSLYCANAATAKIILEPNGNRFLRINDTSTQLMSIRADGVTGIGIYTQDQTGVGISICAQTGGTAIVTKGDNTFISRGNEGTMINRLCYGRVTTGSGGTMGNGSLAYNYGGVSYIPNFIVSTSSKDITVHIPSDMADGTMLLFRSNGSGRINIMSDNSSDRFLMNQSYGSGSMSTTTYVSAGALDILIYDKSSHTWFDHGTR